MPRTTGIVNFGEPYWKNAGEVVAGVDYLTVPKKTYKCGTELQVIDCAQWLASEDYELSACETKIASKGNAGKYVERYWTLTEDVAHVLGLYMAEGNTTDSAAYFTFAKDESAYVQAVADFANKVGVHSSLVASVLSGLCGSKALFKQVPKAVFESPSSVQRAFISGVIAGDGSVPDFNNTTATCTLSLVSSKAVDQMRHLLLNQEVYSHRYTATAGGYRTENQAHRIDVAGAYAVKLAQWLSGPKGDLLRMHVAALKEHKSTVYESGTYYYVPVSSVERKHYSGKVYNIEVAGEHTYQAHRFAVHNCAVFLIDPAELNFDMHGGVQQTPLFESSQEWKLKASRDRGLKPMLRFIAKMINDSIVSKIDDHFMFDFMGLDELTEQEKHELRKEQVATYRTLNEIRREEDLPDVEHGDIVLNPTFTTYLQQKARWICRKSNKQLQWVVVLLVAKKAKKDSNKVQLQIMKHLHPVRNMQTVLQSRFDSLVYWKYPLMTTTVG
ncbi:hypothetical protein HC928_00260 [bacterium]|nr:hypothetical protein [bacterium]